MLIDWFTVGAQALNFAILVWLMQHFLYQPVLHAIDAREQRIAGELADADAKKLEARTERDEFEHKNAEFDQQRAALLRQATDEAKAERTRLIEEARAAAEIASATQRELLSNEARDLSQAVARRTRTEVFAIARQALTDLATTSLEERISEVFTRRLRALDDPARSRLGEALKTASDPAILRSAFDLPTPYRAAIQNALNETFSAEVDLRFETASDLIGGIELASNGQKLAWNIDDYVAALEKSVGDILSQPVQSAAPDQPESVPDGKEEARDHSA